jgi:hypothetical protein
MFWKRESDNWMIITIPLPVAKNEQEEKDRMLRLYVEVRKAVMNVNNFVLADSDKLDIK